MLGLIISAFGSNYDRAVELYSYIKGGTVDYGAAHAERYGLSIITILFQVLTNV
jgi:hypothetical protein